MSSVSENTNLALYRKYRSQTFADVIGQRHITDTLEQAVEHGRISHAYLFTGPRGVGKTSVARLLARAINCTGKAPKPCNKCDMCLAGLNDGGLDIIEIDGASNRGIDDARELRDKIHIGPVRGQYKVYIIDEVHMLTKEAFNALLKTLEEPPAHVVFIMATTEAHKLPATIISRTQRYSFHVIGQKDLVDHLQTIAKREKLELEPAAAESLALASAGGFRDAISLLDQAAGSGQKITNERVLALLGWAEQGLLEGLWQAVMVADMATVLNQLDAIVASGAQVEQLHHQLLLYARGQLHAAVTSKNSDEIATINRILQALVAMPAISQPGIALEATLVGLCAPAQAAFVSPTPPQAQLAPIAQSSKPQPKPAAPAANIDGQLDRALWPKALIAIKASNNSLYALLQSCEVQFGSDDITIQCRFNFHRERLREPKNLNVIQKALDSVYNKPIGVNCELVGGGAAVPKPADSNNELVNSAMEILGGELVDG